MVDYKIGGHFEENICEKKIFSGSNGQGQMVKIDIKP